MHQRRLQALLAGAALALAGPAAPAAPLPVQLSAVDPRWQLAEVQPETASDITFAAVALHAGAPDRLLFLSAPRTDVAPGAPAAFAHRFLDALTAFDCLNLTEQDATVCGYAGRDLRFDLVNDKQGLGCELFVFADAGTWWGLLYVRPQDAPPTAAPSFGMLTRSVPPPPGVVALAPVRVRNTPICDFAVSLGVRWSIGGDRVEAIRVLNVPPGSDAAAAGVKAGDAVVAINGRKVEEIAGGVGKDDELGKIFLNRRFGDPVILKILPPGQSKVVRVTLHAQHARPLSFLFGLFGRH